MAAQNLTVKLTGLFSNPNSLSEAPPGSLDVATNVVIDRASIVESRRGFKVYGSTISTDDVRSLFTFNDTLFCHTAGNEMYYDDGTGTWTKLTGVFQSPAEVKMRSFQSNKNFYFNTNTGIKKITGVGTAIIDAGAPKALSGTGVTTGTTGWMSGNSVVAYRIVWGYKDKNQNLILGAPSDRILVTNTSTETRNASLTFTTPVGVNENWFYQIYRSAVSPDSATVPSDELQMVYESSPTAGELTSRTIVVSDVTPDSLKQAALYTNSTQEGIENANWQPPYAKDMCIYKGHAFYANTRSTHKLFINMVAVGGTDGIQVGDTVTVTDNAGGSFVLYGNTSELPEAGYFKVYTDRTPAENVEATSQSLVAVINRFANNTFVNAYYVSGYDELPGQMLLEKRTLSEDSFYVNSSRSSCWSPRIQSTGQDTISQNDDLPNRVYYSKPQQPEAVPLLNYFDIGTSNQPIERILPLRDGIYVLKTDGIYRISGSVAANFAVAPLDTTIKIIAPESATVVSNQVFFLSDQGVVAVADTGARIISQPIENLMQVYTTTANFPNIKEITTSVGYESDKKYIIFLPKSGSDTYARVGYVFNFATLAWTKWEKDVTCGIVSPKTNKLYFGCPATDTLNSHIKIERKDFAPSDYNDEEFDVTISAVAGRVLTLNTVTNLQIGDAVYQNGFSEIINNISGNNVTVGGTTIFTTGSARVYRPVAASIAFVILDGDNPGVMKHWSRASLFFDDTNFSTVNVTFGTNLNGAKETVTISQVKTNAWGSIVWGPSEWGQAEGALQRFDVIVPRTCQRSNWLKMRIDSSTAFNNMSFNGMSLIYNKMSERQR